MSPDSLGVGLYSIAEASRLLRTPRRTLSRWVEGYVANLRSGAKTYTPVIETDGVSALTFGDLVELMYVRGFRDGGVSLREIRDTTARFRQEWQVQYPLATKRFCTNGRQLLLELGGTWQHALSGQHVTFFEEVGQQLVHMGDLTSEWRPLGKNRQVLLNPDRSFGKPIDDISGAHTFVLSAALVTESDAKAVAWWYGTTTEAVEDAAEFELSVVR